jgi:hypothetical protein
VDPLLGEATAGSLDWWTSGLREAGAGGAAALALLLLVLFPVVALLGVYVGAAIQHFFVWIFVRPRNAGFGATLKANCYASAASLLAWVPVAGLLASVYVLYLTLVGLRELHSTSSARALLAVLPAGPSRSGAS